MQQRILLIAGLVALTTLALFPRVLDLDAVRSPDEKRWVANTNGFTTKLAHGRIAELVQQPHPGITTQWLGALAIRYDDWAVKKLPLVLGQIAIMGAIGYVFYRRWGNAAGIGITAVLITNPFLFGHTRVYAMDGLLALFCLLSLSLLMLWQHNGSRRYLVAAGLTAAAAPLSKLPGITLIPFSLLVILYWAWRHRSSWRLCLTNSSLYGLAVVLGVCIILPSFAIAPMSVIGDFAELFRSDEYLAAHAAPPGYYAETIFFFSTPAQWLLLVLCAPLLWWQARKHTQKMNSESILLFLLFALLFAAVMATGLKKGDRYILPTLVLFDGMAALVLAHLWHVRQHAKQLVSILIAVAGLTIAGQYVLISSDYQHQLAYTNPLTRQWFGDRRHGWGEGLSQAAAYLNEKPNAEDLSVAILWPGEVEPYFKGSVTGVNNHDNGNVDYVVTYRAMYNRGPDAWETDVLQQYADQEPEHIITLSGIDMAWVYKK